MQQLKPLPGREGRVTGADGTFIGLWAWKDRTDPVFAKLREAYDAALKLSNEFSAQRGEIAKNENLTQRGKADELRNWIQANALGVIAKARKVTLPRAKKDVEARRDQLRFEGPDKTDIAGAMMRAEIRTWLRGLPSDERLKLLGADADPLVALAVVEAPAPLSGVNGMTHERLVQKAIDVLHPGKREEIDDLRSAIETTARAVSVTRAAIVSELRISNNAFDRMMDGASVDGAGPVYLRKHFDEVYALYQGEDGMLASRKATDDDLALGCYIVDGDPSTRPPKAWYSSLSSNAA